MLIEPSAALSHFYGPEADAGVPVSLAENVAVAALMDALMEPGDGLGNEEFCQRLVRTFEDDEGKRNRVRNGPRLLPTPPEAS